MIQLIHWVLWALLNQIQLVIFRKKFPAFTKYENSWHHSVKFKHVYESKVLWQLKSKQRWVGNGGVCLLACFALDVCSDAQAWHIPFLFPLLPFCLTNYTSPPFFVKPQDQRYKIDALHPSFYSADSKLSQYRGSRHMTEELVREADPAYILSLSKEGRR